MNADPDAAPIPLDQPRVKKSTTGAPEALNELEARKDAARGDRGRVGSPRTERASSAAPKAAAAKEPAAAAKEPGAGRRSAQPGAQPDDAGRAQVRAGQRAQRGVRVGDGQAAARAR